MSARTVGARVLNACRGALFVRARRNACGPAATVPTTTPDQRRRHLDSHLACAQSHIDRQLLSFDAELTDLQPLINELDANDKEGSR